MIELRMYSESQESSFQYGSISAFQGDLSSVSTSSLVEYCIHPIVLYGVENWIFNTCDLHSEAGKLPRRNSKMNPEAT